MQPQQLEYYDGLETIRVLYMGPDGNTPGIILLKLGTAILDENINATISKARSGEEDGRETPLPVIEELRKISGKLARLSHKANSIADSV